MPNKRMPAAERQREPAAGMPLLQADSRGVTGRMPTLAVGPERALTWAGEPVNTKAASLTN
ncbi:MAG: hypothetical protein WBV74_15385 [Pseudonocardiaceae bacterium]